MKKLVITSACVLALASGAFAQGKVSWAAISASFVTVQTNATTFSSLVGGGSTGIQGGTQGGTSVTPGAYLFELLYNGTSVPSTGGAVVATPSSLAALNGWSDAGLTAGNGTTAGRLIVTGTTGTSVSVPWAIGTTQNVMLVGWSANLGSTWATALATLNSSSALAAVTGIGYFGMSTTGFIAAGGADPGAVLFGSGDSGLGTPIKSLLTQLNVVTPVPEPATIALAGLGGLALLALRRKK